MLKMPTSYIRLISRLVTFQMRRRGVDVAVDSTGFSLKTKPLQGLRGQRGGAPLAANGLTSE
jgi:hypothetical protein